MIIKNFVIQRGEYPTLRVAKELLHYLLSIQRSRSHNPFIPMGVI